MSCDLPSASQLIDGSDSGVAVLDPVLSPRDV